MNSSNDDFIWSIIGKNNFCSYKFNSKSQNFCKNEFNTTGFCSRQSCPLSNSKYATVIQKNGEIYLYIKDSLNDHYPDKLWKKFILSRNFTKSLQELDLILNLWPKFFVYKIKQKLTKLYQILIRKKISCMKKKSFKQVDKKKNSKNKITESSLLNKIKFEKLIELELLHRFNLGVYGDLYPPGFIRKWRMNIKEKKYSMIFKKKTTTINISKKVLNLI